MLVFIAESGDKRGVEVGDRWGRLADNYGLHPRGQYAFDDVHAMLALAQTGCTQIRELQQKTLGI